MSRPVKKLTTYNITISNIRRFVNSNFDSDVGGVRIIETISLKMETYHIVGLGLGYGSYWSKLHDTNLVFNCFWLDVTIVESGRDNLLHFALIYNYIDVKIKIR